MIPLPLPGTQGNQKSGYLIQNSLEGVQEITICSLRVVESVAQLDSERKNVVMPTMFK